MQIIAGGGGKNTKGSRFRDLSNSFHQNDIIGGDGIGKFFQSKTDICLNRYLPSALILSYVDPWLWRGAVGVRSSWSRVPPIQGQPPAYLAHTNPINLPILSWHRDYQHTWPPSWVLTDNLRTLIIGFGDKYCCFRQLLFWNFCNLSSSNLFMPRCFPPPSNQIVSQIYPKYFHCFEPA